MRRALSISSTICHPWHIWRAAHVVTQARRKRRAKPVRSQPRQPGLCLRTRRTCASPATTRAPQHRAAIRSRPRRAAPKRHRLPARPNRPQARPRTSRQTGPQTPGRHLGLVRGGARRPARSAQLTRHPHGDALRPKMRGLSMRANTRISIRHANPRPGPRRVRNSSPGNGRPKATRNSSVPSRTRAAVANNNRWTPGIRAPRAGSHSRTRPPMAPTPAPIPAQDIPRRAQ